VQKRLRARSDSLSKQPAYEPARVDVTIRVPRDIPRARCCCAAPHHFDEGRRVIDNGDIVITDNRIVSVGHGQRPRRRAVIDVSARRSFRGSSTSTPIRGRRGHPRDAGLEVSRQPGVGVTTTRDPQTSTTDVLTYADLVETGEILGPRIYHTGRACSGTRTSRVSRTPPGVAALQRLLSHQHDQDVHDGNRRQRQWVIMARRSSADADDRGGSISR